MTDSNWIYGQRDREDISAGNMSIHRSRLESIAQYHENISNDSTSERQRTSDVIEIFEWFWAILERRERWIDITSALLNKTNICKKKLNFFQLVQKIIRITEQHQSIANCFTRDLSFTGRRYRRELQRTPAL